jgi:hypothetical protein
MSDFTEDNKVMKNLDPVIKFIEESEKFKSTEKYKEMPLDLRDFFNEEIGRFKMLVDLESLQ